MQLVFYGREAQPAVAPTTALLSIDCKGVFSFSVGAVAALGLSPSSPLVLARDVDTNTWYCVLEPVAGHDAFVLKPRDRKGTKALTFHSLPQVRTYWAAHGLNGQRSVRALVSATAVEHGGLRLYPLTPQHPTQAPAPPAEATPAVEAPTPPAEPAPAFVKAAVVELTDETDETDQSEAPADNPEAVAAAPAPAPASRPATSQFTPAMDAALLDPNQLASKLSTDWKIPVASLYARRSYLKKQGKAKSAAATATAPVEATPAAAQLVYTPAPVAGQPAGPAQHKTFGLHARAEELTATWSERELGQAKPNELAELLNLLRMVPESKRSVEMSLVLERAEREQSHRQTVAGKENGRG